MNRVIYFPSFSSKYSLYKKDEFSYEDLDIKTIRFWDDSFPEKFRHKYFLLTAGAFFKKKSNVRQDMGLENSLVFGDSGGFQIANGTIPWSLDIRDRIFNWLEENSDIAMNLDIPPNITYRGRFNEAMQISLDNFKYFEKKQSGKVKFLNVLQPGITDEEARFWYSQVKGFDFQGWGIGNISAQNYNTILATAIFLENGEFENKRNEYYHFLGATSPFNFLIYAAIQKNLNKYYPHAVLTTDSSTPLLQPTFGNYIHSVNWKKFNFNYVYFGNKGKCNYEEEASLPCVLDDCPICTGLKFKNISQASSTEQSIKIGYHNFFMFLKTLRETEDLINSGHDVTSIFFDKEILAMIKSIDDMFENPKDAYKIYLKNKKLYTKLSNGLEKPVDEALKISEELFG